MINLTKDLIRHNASEGNLTDVLSLLDEASTALDKGECETALDLALKANEIVNDRIHGDDSSHTGPAIDNDEPVALPPWLEGYIVVFDHKPTDDDWARMKASFNATFAGEADMYTPEPNAYWVKVSGVSPKDLKALPGVKDVLVYKGGPDIGRDENKPLLSFTMNLARRYVPRTQKHPSRSKARFLYPGPQGASSTFSQRKGKMYSRA